MNDKDVIKTERVKEALEHREADMTLIDFGAKRLTGIRAIAYNNLKDFLGIKSGEIRVYDLFQQLAESEMQIIRLFSGDVIELKRLIPGSRNISGRQKTHTRRAYPKKKAVQLPTNQGEPNMYPAQTKGKSHGEQNNDLMEEVVSRQNMLKAL